MRKRTRRKDWVPVMIHDKTDFIREELRKMVSAGEVQPQLLYKVQEVIQYLKTGNIFKYEQGGRRVFGDELMDVLSVAREKYWNWRKEGMLKNRKRNIKINITDDISHMGMSDEDYRILEIRIVSEPN